MRNFQLKENLSRDEFDGFASDNADKVKTHFLGSYEWGEVSVIRNWKPHYLGVTENGSLVATILVLEKALVLGYTYFYIPRGFTMDYSDQELLAYITSALKDYGKKHRALFFKIDPDIKLHTIDIEGNITDGPDNYELVDFLESLGYHRKPLNYAFENEQPRFTFRIDITGTIEEIQSRYSKTTLHEIRKSHESSVVSYKGTRDDLDDFIRLTGMTEARQGYISHDHSFYGSFYDIMHSRGMADIYTAKVDVRSLTERARKDKADNELLMEKYSSRQGKKARNMTVEIGNRLSALDRKLAELENRPQGEVVASSYITVTYIDKVWTLYGANDMDYSKYYPNYALYEKMIEDAVADGYKVFDGFGTVGRPEADNGAIGLYEFKKKWGGELTEFIGEFDFILNKPVFYAYKKLIPIYHNIRNARIRKHKEEQQ